MTEERPVVLTGPNGAGKTNILEALSFLAPGKGLRRVSLSDITHRNEEGAASGSWAVSALVKGAGTELQIGTGTETTPNKDHRVVKINGEFLKSQAGLSQYINLVWLTPQMDRLFQEGASIRRRFLDRLVQGLNPDHATHLSRYEYYLRERLKLLTSSRWDPYWLSAIEEKLASEGVAIVAARLQLIQLLEQAKAWTLGVFPRALLTLESRLADFLMHASALETEDYLKQLFEKNRKLDAEIFRTNDGAHKDDLKVYFYEKNRSADQCSTGEQKALVLSIVLAASRLQAIEKGTISLLLLDEVVAHLDPHRREALFDEIMNLGMQAWMTGTDENLFAVLGEKVQHFLIKDAIVHPK
jgi:DNA replication and repair protein RecF